MSNTKHIQALNDLKEVGKKYLETEFCKGDAAIMIYLQDNNVLYSIKGEAEDVGCAMACVMKKDPEFLEVIRIGVQVLKKKQGG